MNRHVASCSPSSFFLKAHRVRQSREGPEHLCYSCIRPWAAAWSSGLGLHSRQELGFLKNSGLHSVLLLGSHLHHKPQRHEHPPVVDAHYLPSLLLAVFPTSVLLCLCSQLIYFPVMSLPALQFFLKWGCFPLKTL